MIKKLLLTLLFLIALVLGAALTKFIFIGKDLKIDEQALFLTTSDKEFNVELTYLGTSGFLIGYEGKSLLCDPFISNPSILYFAREYEEWARFIPEDQLRSIQMVMISHGHYDHCYDIEGLSAYLSKGTRILADEGVQHQLQPVYRNKPFDVIRLQHSQPQSWYYSTDSTFRVYPIPSKHSPHLGSIEFFKGTYTEDLEQLPKRMWEWKKGNNYSYLMDVLAADSIVCRLMLTSGNIAAEQLQTIETLCQSRKADVQLQIFWNQELNDPQMRYIRKACGSKKVILQHWDNFFRTHNKSLQYFRTSNLPDALRTYTQEDIPVSIILPFTSVTL